MKEQEKRVFSCPECPNTFRHRTSLTRHRQVDHGPELYAWCERCDFRSARKDNLRRHYRQHHKEHTHEVDMVPLETERERVQRRRLDGEETKETRRVTVSRGLESAETWAEARDTIKEKQAANKQQRGEKRPRGNTEEQQTPKCKVGKGDGGATGGPLDLSVPRPEVVVELSLSPASVSLLDEDVPAPVREPLRGKPRGMFALARGEEEVKEESSEDEEGVLPPEEPAEARAGNDEGEAEHREDLQPIHEVPLAEVLRGRVSRVTEVSTTSDYQEGVKVREYRLHRVYDVQFNQDFRRV